jgi:type I restriction enzyme S subunit
LIGRQGALCGNVHYVSERFWASEHAVVTKAIVSCSMMWLYYLLSVMNLNQYSESAAQPGISVEKIQNLRTIYPCYKEQVFINKYIDDRTKRITTTITNDEREISLMQEYRTPHR